MIQNLILLFLFFFSLFGNTQNSNDCNPKAFAGMVMREHPLLEKPEYQHLKKYHPLPKELSGRFNPLTGLPQTEAKTVKDYKLSLSDVKEWIPMRGEFSEQIYLYEVANFSVKTADGESVILVRKAKADNSDINLQDIVVMPLDRISSDSLSEIARARIEFFGSQVATQPVKPAEAKPAPRQLSIIESLGLDPKRSRNRPERPVRKPGQY